MYLLKERGERQTKIVATVGENRVIYWEIPSALGL